MIFYLIDFFAMIFFHRIFSYMIFCCPDFLLMIFLYVDFFVLIFLVSFILPPMSSALLDLVEGPVSYCNGDS